MGEVWFYHLTEGSLEGTLVRLLPRALARGWMVELRGTDRARMAALDLALWTQEEEGFLPHGLAGGPQDADQPVLLTHEPGLVPPRPCVVALDGAEIAPAEAAGLERGMILFDGADPAALAAARAQWRAVTAAGIGAQYWAQEGGAWVQRQVRPAAPSASG